MTTQFYIDDKWVELDELVEKARLWDEYIGTSTLQDVIRMKDKLGAIRTLNERFKEVPVTMRGEFWKELDKILEDKK